MSESAIYHWPRKGISDRAGRETKFASMTRAPAAPRGLSVSPKMCMHREYR